MVARYAYRRYVMQLPLLDNPGLCAQVLFLLSLN